MRYPVTILIDENEISGLKIGDYLFFRQDKDDVVTFFNSKMVPTLIKYRGINLKDYYEKENITIVEEKDYNLTPYDTVMIADKEKGDIALTENYYDLYYNQKIYIAMLTKNLFQEEFDYSNPTYDYKQARLQIIKDINDELQISNDKQKVLHEYFSEEIANKLMTLDNQNLDLLDLISKLSEERPAQSKK